MRADLRASKHPPKGLAPLHLGTAAMGRPVLIVEESGRFAKIEIPGATRGTSVGIGCNAAEALSDWLHRFANPEPDLELWGIDGIASKCKVSRSTVYNWTAKPDFPAPVPVVGGNGHVWESRAVRAWVRLQRRKGGRPRKQRARG